MNDSYLIIDGNKIEWRKLEHPWYSVYYCPKGIDRVHLGFFEGPDAMRLALNAIESHQDQLLEEQLNAIAIG